jgi:PAS domain-containing protein
MLAREGTVVGLESVWTKKDGTSIFVRESATVVQDNQGKVIYYDGTFEDITERKHAEEQVRAAQQFSQGTIDALSAHICVLDENGVIVSVNRAWCEFAEANPPLLDDYGLGLNYLHVCEQASGKDSEGAFVFAKGIRSVMRQETNEFVME